MLHEPTPPYSKNPLNRSNFWLSTV